MTNTTLDGASTPFVIPPGTIEQINDGDSLFLLGTIDNQGTIFTNGVGTPSATNVVSIVLASPAVTLEGGGTLLLSGAADSQLYGSTAAIESLVNVDNTITGSGDIGETSAVAVAPGQTFYPIGFTNEAGGVIDFNGTVTPTGFPPPGIIIGTGTAPLVNDGLMEATGIDDLIFDSATIDQSGGGTILASGVGVVAGSGLGAIDIIGGTLAVSDGGQIGVNRATLDGSVTPLTVGAGIDFSEGNVTSLLGTIDNLGTLDMTGAGFSGGNIFLASATVTLTGTGEVLDPTLTGAGGNPVALVNVANTISGAGTIGIATIDATIFGPLGGSAPVALTNEAAGVINASDPTSPLTLFGGGSLSLNNGLLEATGIGGLTIDAATIDQSGGGTLLASGAGVAIDLQDVDLIGGAVQTSGGGAIDFNGGNNTLTNGPRPLVISAGGTLEVSSFTSTGTLTLDAATIDNLGTLLAQGGTMTVTGDVGGSGSIAIAPDAAFVLGGTSAETVDFRDAQNDRLVLNTPTAFTGTLANMTYGDIVDLGTADVQSAVVVGGNTLAVTLIDSSTIDYTLAGLQAGTSFAPGPTTSELVVACFAEGTRIRLAGGERRVETLRAGDAVVTANAGLRRVIWVGHRRIACDRHPRPREVRPVRIRAHAFGPNAPRADLLLSPDHALFIDGHLIPVRYLVNGATVVREDVSEITYWHVELDAHDALLAENLPCESYLDTGNRGAFVECYGATMMHADFARAVWDTRAFAPLALAGPAVEAVRLKLVRHAEALGYRLTAKPALYLSVDGQTLWPSPGENGAYRFVLPAAARDLRIMSRAGVPAETSVANGDHRRLGVAIAAMRANGRAIALDDARLRSGWHAPERGWRWTDGAATLSLSGVRELAIVVAITEHYWIMPERAATRPAAAAR